MLETITTQPRVGGSLALKDLIGWALALFKGPRAFFRGMEKKGGYWTPILYLAFWVLVSTLVSFLVTFIRPMVGQGPLPWRLVGILFSPVMGLVVSFFITAGLFVIWHLMGSKEDFQTAFRVWALTTPLWVVGSILGLVPFLPGLVILAFFYLLVVASQEVHGISRERSWLVWGILAGIFFLFSLMALVVGQAARQLPNDMRGAFPPARAAAPR